MFSIGSILLYLIVVMIGVAHTTLLSLIVYYHNRCDQALLEKAWGDSTRLLLFRFITLIQGKYDIVFFTGRIWHIIHLTVLMTLIWMLCFLLLIGGVRDALSNQADNWIYVIIGLFLFTIAAHLDALRYGKRFCRKQKSNS